ncbi:DUF6497 family protein [Pseudooceanicola nanhaiensis]|uniref:DUF6497 family protein n=1 Tax=Pseudooceanicola nanhaiensis TaxID=375761 RepID=UPI001CD3BBA7|nr:DUF6497 family protein [Pseudooceanicola nanhaiensis]MCA0919519.1 DUF6497 family protein [Pseudooceanicola nanhaiensis]
MHRAVVTSAVLGGALFWATAPVAGQEDAPTVPSGLVLHLQEIRLDDASEGGVVRFRYVADGLTGAAYDRVEGDFAALCEGQVLPWAAGQGDRPGQAIISLASSAVDFGVSAPDVTQYFEAFRLEEGRCIWEMF